MQALLDREEQIWLDMYAGVANWRPQPKTVIEEARLASGLGQAELAALAGTSQPTLSAYERGKKMPGLGGRSAS